MIHLKLYQKNENFDEILRKMKLSTIDKNLQQYDIS